MEVTRFHFFLYLSQPRCFFEKLPRLWFIYCSIYDLGSQLLQILQSRLPPKCGAALSLCYENMQLDLRKTLRDQKINDWPWLLWRFGWCRITTVTTVCSFIPGLSSIRLHFTAKWFTRNSEVKAQHASYPWWGLGYSLLPLFTSWCVSWPLSSTKEVANLQAIFGITKNFPIPKKMGKVTRLTSSQQFSQRRKKGGGGEQIFQKKNFSKKFPMKTNDFLFALLRFQAWKALNEASESGDSVLQGMTQVLWRGSAEVLEQTDLPKSLRSLKLGRNYNTPNTRKSLIWHTKIERMGKKDSKLNCRGGCCSMIWEEFGQITTKNAHPKDGFDDFALQFQSVTRGAQKRVLWYLPEITIW